MSDAHDNLDERIALARRNIADLTEQAAAAAGAGAEEALAARLDQLQSQLDDLLRRREALESKGPA
ncbi:hypothetical protein ASE63_13195 [Bosea sp. Root381]|uniref:hypothetical protein n=1 Tax=Bosea sp. Root381 TaxID=1736524 RepID=UPI0006F96602|nr:hypothetical protein [Bosea sp. Root381]KRE17406.1 hypothetical protein ASE63_13195 [Bosea sp. Root381]